MIFAASPFLFRSRRPWILLAIALICLVGLTVVAAPQNPQLGGSTYSRSPSGYGAWFQYMSDRGTPVQRWERPFSDLVSASDEPITLLRVNSGLASGRLSSNQRTWIGQGNRLIVLGVQTPVTEAPYTTHQSSEVGAVKVETTRRYALDTRMKDELQLGDRFGAVVWRQAIGQGEAILAITPHLAANAYQDEPGNFEFLAQLVARDGYALWVDEFIHGYRVTDESTAASSDDPQSWPSYLAQTPFLPLALQGFVLLAVLIWAKNHRFGQPISLVAPPENNSQAYIRALAAVLRKAGSSSFVVEMLGRQEQLQVQQVLGLGKASVDAQTLLSVWAQRTGRPASELERVMKPYWKKQTLSDPDLILWLKALQSLQLSLRSLSDARSASDSTG